MPEDRNQSNRNLDRRLNFDVKKPFFAYGFLKKGELAFSKIEEFIEDVEKDVDQGWIKGELFIKDGIPIVYVDENDPDRIGNHNTTSKTIGTLIKFKDTEAAYNAINEFEPGSLYDVVQVNVNDKIPANCLVCSTKILEDVRLRMLNKIKGAKQAEEFSSFVENSIQYDWNSENDLLFSNGMTYIRDSLVARSIPVFSPVIDPVLDLIDLQTKYILLWSIVERYITMKHRLKKRETNEHGIKSHLMRDEEIKNAILYLLDNGLFMTWDGGTIIESASTKSFSFKPNSFRPITDESRCQSVLNYFYAIRNNAVHRGKAAITECELVRDALDDFYRIMACSLVYSRTKNWDDCKKLLEKKSYLKVEDTDKHLVYYEVTREEGQYIKNYLNNKKR